MSIKTTPKKKHLKQRATRPGPVLRATNKFIDLPHTLTVLITVAHYLAAVCGDLQHCIMANALSGSGLEDPILGKLIGMDARGGVWKTYVSLFFERPDGTVQEYRGQLSSKAIEQVRAFDDLRHNPRALKALQRSWLDIAKNSPGGVDHVVDRLVINPPRQPKNYRANVEARGRHGSGGTKNPVIRLRTIIAHDDPQAKQERAKAARALSNARRAVEAHKAHLATFT